MMDSILWDNATRDYDAEQRTAQLERARVALAETVPFIVKAASHDEYLDRIALMQDKIEATLRGLASSEAEYVGLFGSVMSSLDEDFNTLRQARRVKAEAEMDAEEPEDDSDAPEASEDAEEASDDEDESDDEEESDDDEPDADAESDDDEDEPEAADKKESRRLRALRQSHAVDDWRDNKGLGFSYKTIRLDGDPYDSNNVLELSVDYMPDDGAYQWYVHDSRTDSPYALESGDAPSITAAKWAAERAAKELSSSASRKRASRKTGVAVEVSGMVSDEGSVIILRGNEMEWSEEDEMFFPTANEVTFAADHRNAQMMLDALDAGEPVETDVPSWAVLSRGASRKRASRKVARADFWDAIDAQIEELRSAKSADDVINILSFDRNPYGPEPESGDAFFAGSGGDKTVWGALMNAGWKFVDHQADYYWVMRAPDGSEITYIEGDIYRGNRMSKSSARRPNRKRANRKVASDPWTYTGTGDFGDMPGLPAGYRGPFFFRTFGDGNEFRGTVWDIGNGWGWRLSQDEGWMSSTVAEGVHSDEGAAKAAVEAEAQSRGISMSNWIASRKRAVTVQDVYFPADGNFDASDPIAVFVTDRGNYTMTMEGDDPESEPWFPEEPQNPYMSGPYFYTIRDEAGKSVGSVSAYGDEYSAPFDEAVYNAEQLLSRLGVRVTSVRKAGSRKRASRRKRASDMAHGGAAPVRYVAVDEDGVRRLVSTDRIPARWRSYDWTVWAEYADGSSSRVTGPAPTASRRRANRKTAINFEDTFPAGHVAKNLFDRNGDPIVFHTQTYQILGSPGSRYQVIGLQTREHSMQMMGSDANLVLSEDGATPARTSNGMLGGQFNVIPVPSTTAFRRKRGSRRHAISDRERALEEHTDLLMQYDEAEAREDAAEMRRLEELIDDAHGRLSEEQFWGDYYQPIASRRKRATRKTAAGWKKVNDSEWRFAHKGWKAEIYKHNGKFFWEFIDPKDPYYDRQEPETPVVGGEERTFEDALLAVESEMYSNAIEFDRPQSYFDSLAWPFEDVMNDRVRSLSSRKTARKPVKGIAIYPDKRVEEVTISSLSDYQSIVGGLIEPVMLSDGSTLYVNEEGMYLFGPDDFNSIATDVAGLGGASHILMTGILGPAVLVGPVSNDGYDTDVTSAARAWVNRVAREASVKRRGSRRRAATDKLLVQLPNYTDTCGCSIADGRCRRHSSMLQTIKQAYDALPDSDLTFQKMWAISDGYGTPGYAPPGEGINWSGIRDSSTAAIEAMFEIASGSRTALRRRTAAPEMWEVRQHDSNADGLTHMLWDRSEATPRQHDYYTSPNAAENTDIVWGRFDSEDEATTLANMLSDTFGTSSPFEVVRVGKNSKRRKAARRRTAANKMYEVEVEGHEEYLDEDFEEIDPDSYNTEVVYVSAPNEYAAAEAAEEWLSVTLFEPQMVSVRETSDSVSADVTLNPDGTWRTTAGYKPKKPKPKKHARRRTAYFDYTVNPTGDENYNYDEYLRGRADGYDDGYDVGSNKPNAKDRRNEWDMDPKNDYQVGYGFGFSEGVQRGVDERYPVMQPDWFDPADAGERWSDDY